MSDFERHLRDDYRLTTAEILYHLPDAPSLLQTFIWQEYDVPPRFPILEKFVRFWEENIEGPLHSVRVAYSGPLMSGGYSFRGVEVTFH